VVSVAYVRAVRGFQTMMFQLVFSVAPTILELGMVAHILSNKFAPVFATITLATFSIYLLFTVLLTQWRVNVRVKLVDCDNERNGE
jgi:ABC-type transport system involved in Fe-S cluster assembly fused permease/ATPase subunit